jgi:hypothetical protein
MSKVDVVTSLGRRRWSEEPGAMVVAEAARRAGISAGDLEGLVARLLIANHPMSKTVNKPV